MIDQWLCFLDRNYQANTFGGISLITTLPAPITEPCAIFTPGQNNDITSSHVLSPISIVAFLNLGFDVYNQAGE